MKKIRLVCCFFILLSCAVMFLTVDMAEKTTIASGESVIVKRVAITFDDGPKEKTTMRLLDGLKERNVRAAFFVVGENVETNRSVIKRMYDEGHIIGNHTYLHTVLTSVSFEEAKKEIDRTNELIFDITGEKAIYIRPPCGEWNDELLYNIDMTEVLWNVDPVDWNCNDSREVVRRVLGEVKDGSIILLHDIFESSVTAALEIIDELKAQGYIFVGIDEILIE